jgi:hypothetical protein
VNVEVLSEEPVEIQKYSNALYNKGAGVTILLLRREEAEDRLDGSYSV